MKKEKTSRDIPERISTRIWSELPKEETDDESAPITVCHGYDFYNDLLDNFTWTELFYLLLKGDLPSKKNSALFNLVLCSIINPGPWDWSTQAAMTAAVTHATVGNCLLTGMAVLQGRFNGALCLEQSMLMIQENTPTHFNKKNAEKMLLAAENRFTDLPGYGLSRGKRDFRAVNLMKTINDKYEIDKHLRFALEFEKYLVVKKKIWLTSIGVCAAVFSDLGFTPKEGHGIYLLAAGPGILSHLLEQMQGSWHTYPFHPAPAYKGPKNKTLDTDQKIY